jgi:hypothetical protein
MEDVILEFYTVIRYTSDASSPNAVLSGVRETEVMAMNRTY